MKLYQGKALKGQRVKYQLHDCVYLWARTFWRQVMPEESQTIDQLVVVLEDGNFQVRRGKSSIGPPEGPPQGER